MGRTFFQRGKCVAAHYQQECGHALGSLIEREGNALLLEYLLELIDSF